MKIKHSHKQPYTFYLGGDFHDNTIHDLEQVVRHFTKRDLIQKLMIAHEQKSGTTKIALLMAHSQGSSDEYRYYDHPDVPTLVQDWINKHDGEYNVLIVAPCNMKNHEVESNKSIVIHSTRKLSLAEMMRSKGGFSKIYIPTIGYFEKNYYQIKKYLKSLY